MLSFPAPGIVLLIAHTAVAPSFDLDAVRVFSGLSTYQWNAVTRGEPQARTLDTREKREVAVVGVAHLQTTTACFVSKFQDIENFKKNPAVLRIRKFMPPIEPQDFAAFQLEPRDVADLRSCTTGHCSVKLPPGAIARLQTDVDWNRPDYAGEVQAVVREELLAYLETYLHQGNAALVEYRDKSNPVPLAREFRAVLDARPGLADLAPSFREYLMQYWGAPSPGVTDFLYWSTENFGLKPVDSITHVFVYAEPGRAAIASKQIYASHYFDASLGLTAALDDGDDPSHPGMYLVYLNRSRIDLLGGFFGGLRRAILRGRLRDGMRKNLVEVVRKLESSCAEHADANPITQ